ncbi:MAG TPA: ABC transporter permease [Streptosporangiaceae bacterium]
MRIISFAASRLAGLAVTLLITSFIVYGALYIAPGNPIATLTGGRPLPQRTIAAIQAEYGLDQPFLLRYVHWLGNVLKGNFGQSIVFRENVSTLIAARASTTTFLVAYAALLIILFGVVLGAISALRKGPADTAILASTTIGIATPSFVAAILMISVFTLGLHWFPAIGAGSGFADRLWHLTMPAAALALAGTAYVARLTRAAANEELQREHVDTARSRGIPEALVVKRHVLRNAMIPVTTVAGLTVAGLIAGSVVVENAFAVNGLGSYLVTSVEQKDFGVVQAITLLLVAAFVLVNTAVDMLYALIDPRVRVAGAGR